MCLDVINQTWSPMFGKSLGTFISSLPTQQQQQQQQHALLYAFGIMTRQRMYLA